MCLFSLAVLHILHDEEGSAEVDKASDSVLSAKQILKHLDQSLLAVVHVDQVLVLLNQVKSLLELRRSVLLRHVRTELVEVA